MKHAVNLKRFGAKNAPPKPQLNYCNNFGLKRKFVKSHSYRCQAFSLNITFSIETSHRNGINVFFPFISRMSSHFSIHDSF